MVERIAKILQEYKGDDNLTITEATTFVELELDSLDTVELVMSVEEEFGISLTLESPVKTIGDLMALIQGVQ